MPDPHLRAGDTDRVAVATVLGQHMAEGRLTVAEYDERVARAYAAQTYGDLSALTADLPQTGVVRAPEPVGQETGAPTHSRAGRSERGHDESGRDLAAAWAAWLRVAIIVVGIWAVISVTAMQFTYFWPIWVVGPWGAVLVAHTVGGGRRPGSRQRS